MEQIDFKDYGLSQQILKALKGLNYNSPTKVQRAVLKEALAGKDLMVKSQTGSGKTAAFAIPLCEQAIWEENKPRALVLTPTRELALQVYQDFFNIGRYKRLKIVALYGRAPFDFQRKQLKQKTHIVVGTPGRVLDHLEKGTLDVSEMKQLVIDEADEMLRMGFLKQVGEILKKLPKQRQTMLFSATMGPHIEGLVVNEGKPVEKIEIEQENITVSRIMACCYEVREEEKLKLLEKLLIKEQPECAIIFCNKKDGAQKLYEKLKEKVHSLSCIHGSMEQKERFAVMEAFRRGRFRYLIATDVAARGIDIEHITHVINYDVPEDKENYVHRIGRTGRNGRSGKAFTFVSPKEAYYLRAIEKYIQQTIPREIMEDEAPSGVMWQRFEEKMHTPLQVQEQKGQQLNEGILKLHINAGRKTKMRPVDIVGTLCHLPGVEAEDIGIINIQDVSTFVEILNGKGEQVLKALQKTPIKGRMRVVTKANQPH